MKWISVDNSLPKDKSYVLGMYNGGNWRDKDDPIKVNVVVVKFVRGISLDEKSRMGDTDRARTHKLGDEGMNNERPFVWEPFGPGCFFGQEISYWAEIDLPKKGI